MKGCVPIQQQKRFANPLEIKVKFFQARNRISLAYFVIGFKLNKEPKMYFVLDFWHDFWNKGLVILALSARIL